MINSDQAKIDFLIELLEQEMRKRMETLAEDLQKTPDQDVKHYLIGLQRGYDVALFELYQARKKLEEK